MAGVECVVYALGQAGANLGLVVTGSSDYHGANKDIAIGRFTTHPAALEELVGRSSGAEVVVG